MGTKILNEEIANTPAQYDGMCQCSIVSVAKN